MYKATPRADRQTHCGYTISNRASWESDQATIRNGRFESTSAACDNRACTLICMS